MRRHHGDYTCSSPNKVCCVCANHKQGLALVHTAKSFRYQQGSRIEQPCVESMLCFCFTCYRRSYHILPQPLLALPRVRVFQEVMHRGELGELQLREYEQSRVKSSASRAVGPDW